MAGSGERDVWFAVILIGESGVGKSCVMKTYVEDSPHPIPPGKTIGKYNTLVIIANHSNLPPSILLSPWLGYNMHTSTPGGQDLAMDSVQRAVHQDFTLSGSKIPCSQLQGKNPTYIPIAQITWSLMNTPTHTQT